MFLKIFCLIEILIFIPLIKSDDEFETNQNIYTLILEHQLGVEGFTRRGLIKYNTFRSSKAEYVDEFVFEESHMKLLQDAVEKDQFYKIRVSQLVPNENRFSIQSFIKACSLYESNISDILILNVDAYGELVGVTIKTDIPYCTGTRQPISPRFNTSIFVQLSLPGPVPETEMYIRKLEMEKQQAKGQQADNRSFFAKYWMYIVPFFIFMVIMNNSADQTGGGNR